nr:MAG TPA: hypothetical protein [Caudoviricetes sp.]
MVGFGAASHLLTKPLRAVKFIGGSCYHRQK